MMAPPFRWYDQFVDRGHPRHLPRSSLRLILGIGRHVDAKTLRTRVSLERLCKDVGLSLASFYRAQFDLRDRGLIEVDDQGQRCYVLTFPPPAANLHILRNESADSQKREPTRSRMRLAKARKTRRTQIPADGPQQIKNSHLGKQTSSALVHALAEHCGEVPDGVALVGILEKVRSSAALVAGAPEVLPHEAIALSLGFQAEGWSLGARQVRDVLIDAVALIDPAVQPAEPILNGDVLGVRPSHEKETEHA